MFLNKKNSIIIMFSFILPFILLYGTKEINRVEKYALIVVGMSETNTQYYSNIDKIDRDFESIEMDEIYNTLKENGFKNKNIFFLYPEDYIPNFNETSDDFKTYYISSEPKGANETNIRNVLSTIKSRIDSNDIFLFIISAHGDENGIVYLQSKNPWNDEYTIDSEEFKDMLSNFPSTKNYAIFSTCFSGIFVKKVDIENFVRVSITSDTTLGWIDRNFNSPVLFLKFLFDTRTDIDGDYKIEVEEVVKMVNRVADMYKDWLNWYIENCYTETISKNFNLYMYFKKGENFEDITTKIIK